MRRSRPNRAMRGFSLIEMLVVTSISLTVASVAIPKVMTAVANVELRGAVHSAAGVLQQTRMRAIKDDASRTAKYYNSTDGGIVYADLNSNSTPESTEPQAELGRTVLAYSAPTGIPSLTSTDLNYSPVTTTSVSFSPTGQPCSTSACAVGMVLYFTDSRVVGAPGWAATSISPAGRVATWMWTGSAWQQM